MTLTHPLISKHDISGLWYSTIGIEREAIRIDYCGNFAKTPHSNQWGSRSHHPYIQTDFAENQLEFITPPLVDIDHTIGWLSALHQIVATTNEDNQELLWPFSTPAVIPSDRNSIPVAQLTNSQEKKYREHLADFYGKDVQLISGIHFNFQFNPRIIDNRIKHLASSSKKQIEMLNNFYVQIGRNYFRYRWLITYLLSASPYIAEDYDTKLYGRPHQTTMRSFRQSRYGYHNDPDLSVSYKSLDAFVDSLEHAVRTKQISMEKELYRDLRFRGTNKMRDLLTEGIKYLEFRNFDINPYSPYGMTREDMLFIRLFIISLLFLPNAKTDYDVELGNDMNQFIAEGHPLNPCPYIEEGMDIFNTIDQVLSYLPEDVRDELTPIIEEKRLSLLDSSKTLSGQIIQWIKKPKDYLTQGIKLAKQYQNTYTERPYHLHGFEDLELSSQDVMKEALRLGIHTEIIDRQDNFLQFKYHDHVEWVKQANFTRLDNLISYFLMENKVTTKKALSDANINVPRSENFIDKREAYSYYFRMEEQAIVIKPKNTNFGLGISIFKEFPSYENYQQAVDLAFSEDKTILIEEFLPGTELRFYVQGQKLKAICQREAAHVIGDGTSTVSQLIDIENKNPLRGKKHFAPLTILEEGELESLQLNEQGYNFDSIPEKGTKVFLRENSNVSTGGISIDRTDEVHDDFKKLAIKCAQTLGANFCGIDFIIEDYTKPIHNQKYGVIEANFNPNIAIHRFPAIGTPRLLGFEVLNQLFPEGKFIKLKS